MRFILIALAFVLSGCNMVVVPPQLAPRQDYTLECRNKYYDECHLDSWETEGEL